jgi:hypothetical protein
MSQTYVPADLRRLVRERAQDRCEYCLIPESATFAAHWIDHIMAEKHSGETKAENLANSCVVCNLRKGPSSVVAQWPQKGAIGRGPDRRAEVTTVAKGQGTCSARRDPRQSHRRIVSRSVRRCRKVALKSCGSKGLRFREGGGASVRR